MDDLTTLLPISRATWTLVVAGVTTLAFVLSAFACDRLGHTIISPFLGSRSHEAVALGAFCFAAPTNRHAAGAARGGVAGRTKTKPWPFLSQTEAVGSLFPSVIRRNYEHGSAERGCMPSNPNVFS